MALVQDGWARSSCSGRVGRKVGSGLCSSPLMQDGRRRSWWRPERSTTRHSCQKPQGEVIQLLLIAGQEVGPAVGFGFASSNSEWRTWGELLSLGNGT